MSDLRVYEAARKLNISVDEALGIFAEKGVEVKSPISIITQAQFDEVLNSYMAEPRTPAAKTAEPLTQEEPVSASAPVEKEKERGRLALVTPISAKLAQETPQAQAPHEADENEDETPAKETPVESQPDAFIKETAYRAETSGGSTSNLTLAAAGLSVVAVIAAIILAVVAVRNAQEVSALGATVQANQTALNEARNDLNDLKAQVEINRKLDVRAGLSQRSATLEEISGAIPGPNGEKLRNIASKLNALASGM